VRSNNSSNCLPLAIVKRYGSKKRKDIPHALRRVFEGKPVYSDEFRTNDEAIGSDTKTKATL